MDCKEILVTIGLLGYKNVLIEGGYNTIRKFIDHNLIDIFYFFKNDQTISKKMSHSFKNINMILLKKFKNKNKLIEFLKNDKRNINNNFFCEIYDNKFFHYRAGGNWLGEGLNFHIENTKNLHDILLNLD